MGKFVQRLWQALTQAAAEADSEFSSEIARRSWQGLRVLGTAMVLVPLAMVTVVGLLLPDIPTPAGSMGLSICIAGMGAALLALQRSGVLYDQARGVAFTIACMACLCVIWSSLLRVTEQGMFLYLINGQIAVVILIALASVPFRPLQIFLVGLLATLFFAVSYRLAIHWTLIPDNHAGDLNLLFLSMVTVLATAVSVSQYRQIYESHRMHHQQLEASEQMRDAQCRVLLSDSAASMGRLAAALSHELNNPLGILKSNLDTMSGLLGERRDLPPHKLAKIAGMKQELCRNSQESVERLERTVERMQRFTNLDRAEIMPVDINQLLRDVSEVVGDAMERRVPHEMELRPLSEVAVRPQLMSAVFSALLQNAAEASRDRGGVRVDTLQEGEMIRIGIEDRGKGMSPREIREAMEPSFRVERGRVAACNWNLFGARQIVREHGGDITISSKPGIGTRVEVHLPARRTLT